MDDLSDADRERLRQMGFDPDRKGAQARAKRRAAEEWDRLARSGLTISQAARRIGVTEAEIAGMIDRRELVAIARDGKPVLLECQFYGHRLVRHIAKINAARWTGIDPVSYEAWLMQILPALWIYGVAQEAEGGIFGLAVSPREWLEHGEDPEVLIRLAGEQ